MPTPQISPELLEHMRNNSECDLEKMFAITEKTDPEKYQQNLNHIHAALTGQNEPMPATNMLYDDSKTPMPGQPTPIVMEHMDFSDLKKSGENKLIANAASEKLKRERQRPLEVRLREFTIKSLHDEQKRQFFANHGYQMSGKQRRTLLRRLTAAYDKGRVITTQKQREDLIATMESPLNNIDNTVQGNQVSGANNKEPIQPGALL